MMRMRRRWKSDTSPSYSSCARTNPPRYHPVLPILMHLLRDEEAGEEHDEDDDQDEEEDENVEEEYEEEW